MVERVWQWRFAASPEALWPYLADTARFNEAAGLGRYAVADTALPDGSVLRRGSIRVLGMTLAWDEGVPNWIAGTHYSHHRRFDSGPLRGMAVAIDLQPDAGGGSRVRYRLSLDAGNRAVAVLLRLGGLGRFGKTLDKLFREAAEACLQHRPHPFELPPPKLPDAVRERVAAHARALTEGGYAYAEPLAAHLLNAAESDLERMRPRALARQWGAEPRGVIETFLAAARDGLLALRWDLLCPRCRGAKVVAASLDRLPQGAHCSSCNIDYERDFAENVEVTFEPAAQIRALGIGTYCIASPLAGEHVKVQYTLAAGRTATLDVELADGDYRVRTIEPGGSTGFRVEGGLLPEIAIGPDDPVLSLGTTPGRLVLHNIGPVERTVVIEDRRWASDAISAHEVTTMQAFRDLFAASVLRPGDQVAVHNVALMFTDLKGSSDLYNRVGDARAYGWVREHYAVLTRAIRAHDGAVVKTIGDAVMAAFAHPGDALGAALAIGREIAAFDRRLLAESGTGEIIVVKLGLHCGPCIAVTLNDRLDYFGRTVNLAARLGGVSSGGDIVLSADMAADPQVAALLSGLAPVAEQAHVKGFSEPVPILRLAVSDPLGE